MISVWVDNVVERILAMMEIIVPSIYVLLLDVPFNLTMTHVMIRTIVPRMMCVLKESVQVKSLPDES
jgi:flagellar biosynthesis protein FliR